MPLSNSSSSEPEGANRSLVLLLPVALAVQTVILAVLGYWHRYQINPDAVAYIRIALYFTRGDFGLAVSGYWGPMLSWLIAPILRLVDNPLFAARIVMGLSALIFTMGGIAVFRAVRLTRHGMVLGTGLLILAGSHWSVTVISPDLLMSGLLALASSLLFSRSWPYRWKTQLLAGLAFGLACLTKSVALPITVLLIAGLGFLPRASRRGGIGHCLRASATTMVAVAVIVFPWALCMSIKYGKPVLSTSAGINHAIVGPGDIERYHPIVRGFRVPEQGRITDWEDPPVEAYHYWSPIENRGYFLHQCRLLKKNFSAVLDYLGSFDRFRLGLASLSLCCVALASGWKGSDGGHWRWSIVPAASVGVIYLPIYCSDPRYYYLAYPYLFASSSGLINSLSPDNRSTCGRPLGILILTWSFLVPLAYDLAGDVSSRVGWDGRPPDWLMLARAIDSAGVKGPIAGADSTGMYLGLFSQRTFLGSDPRATPESFAVSGAGLIVVARGTVLARELSNDARFQDLSPALRIGPEVSPHQVFRITDRASCAGRYVRETSWAGWVTTEGGKEQ
ncbi:MAG: hypothetical protein NVSMB9_18490 [Isosphaeraceae bacterium]